MNTLVFLLGFSAVFANVDGKTLFQEFEEVNNRSSLHHRQRISEIIPDTYHQELACNDMYSFSCSGKLKKNFIWEQQRATDEINKINDQWPQPTDATAQQVLTEIKNCEKQTKSFRQQTQLSVEESLLEKVEQLCDIANIDVCNGDTQLYSEQLIELSLFGSYEWPMHFVFEKREQIGVDHFDRGVYRRILEPKMLGKKSLLTWLSTADDNHHLYLREEIQQYRTELSQTTGLSASEANRVISFLHDLAQIQNPQYTVNHYFANPVEVCLNGDHWPKWLMEKCAKHPPTWAPDTNEIYVYDTEFVYAIQTLLERHAPTMRMIAAIAGFSSNRPSDIKPLTAECQLSKSKENIANNFRFARRLEEEYGLPYLHRQKKHAEYIVENVRSALIHQLQRSDLLTTRTRDVLIATARSVSVTLGLPSHFFEENWNQALYDMVNSQSYTEYCTARLWKNQFYIDNARASPQCDQLVFNQVYIQRPMLDHERADNEYVVYDYAALGSVVAHELEHHFDSWGLRYLTKNYTEIVLTDEERQNFRDSARCFRHDLEKTCCHRSGKNRICTQPLLNQGEDISDLLSVTLSLAAYEVNDLAADLKEGIARGELTEETGARKLRQLFFYVNAAQWCHYRWMDPTLGFIGVIDEHSPDICRVNTVFRQMPEFAEAFGCDARFDHMTRPENDQCTVWK